MKAFVFPGQGSQHKGMGYELFDRFPELARLTDNTLGYSIRELCVDNPDNKLTQTQFTQPALFVVNALSYYQRVQDHQQVPEFVAGHSLGEFNALLAAEVFRFEDGLRLVKRRGEIMSTIQGGGMAAVIGMEADAILRTLMNHGINTIDIANYNSPQQIVISGPKSDIDSAVTVLDESGARMVVKLKVSGAFHSRYMRKSQEQFSLYLSEFALNPPRVPVIANHTACPYRTDSVAETLSNQIANPVKWTETIRYLLSRGVDEFVEVGPGNVLTGLIRRIRGE